MVGREERKRTRVCGGRGRFEHEKKSDSGEV